MVLTVLRARITNFICEFVEMPLLKSESNIVLIINILKSNFMKKLRVLLSLFLLCIVTTGAAQHVHGDNYLGIWTYIDVDLQNDPVDSEGDLIYPMPIPPEGCNFVISGVGMPRLIDYNGTGDMMLHLRKEALEIATRHDTEIVTYDLGFPVSKRRFCVYSDSYIQCYYVVRLVIKP